MTQGELPFSEPAKPALITLQDAFDFYQDANSDHPRRSNVRSCFKVIGRGLGRPLDLIPASDVAQLRQMVKEGSAARAGIKPRGWIAAKSTTLGALRAAGVHIRPSRDDTQISPAWQALLEKAPERRFAIGLGRVVRYLTRMGVEPDGVEVGHLEAWLTELKTTSVRSGDPETSYRDMVRLWTACEQAVSEWPRVAAQTPQDPRIFSLAWETFPESLRDEVDAFLKSRLDPDPLSANAPKQIRRDTHEGRQTNLRIIASALVLSGEIEVNEVTGVAVLTKIENVRAALRYMREQRFDGEVRPQMINLADLLRILAKFWEEDQAKADAIAGIIKSLKGRMGDTNGLRPKNRLRLAQFDNKANVKALMELPLRTLREASKGPRSHLTATRVMYAVGVAILLNAPIRRQNLTSIKYGVNLIESGVGKDRTIRLFFPAHETKTWSDYTAVLPARLLPLLDAWRTIWRPVICDQASPYLFANAGGSLRAKGALSAKIVRFVKRETGLVVNLHLFRHLAAKLYLAFRPDGIEMVRQLLGHKSTKTTLKAYAELATEPAFANLEEALLDAYDQAKPGRRK